MFRVRRRETEKLVYMAILAKFHILSMVLPGFA